MALGLATTLRNSRLEAINTAANAGSGAAYIDIYDGTRPATGGTVTTKLGRLTMSDPAFLTPSGGVMSADTISDDASADDSGEATWFRLVDSDENFVMDGSCGTTGADLNLNTTTITAGLPIAVTSMTLTEGNA